MAEIGERLFEYLFTKTVKEKRPLSDFVNKHDDKIKLLYLKGKEYAFLISGNLETDYFGRYKENGPNANLIYIRPLKKDDKVFPIPRTEILRIDEECSAEDFIKEAEGIYMDILKSQGAEEPEQKRLQHRKLFGQMLEEAAQMELELTKKKNEDIWAYAKRLADDERSAAKRAALQLIKQADADISELWQKLRYETDPKRRTLTEKVIDRIILSCLDDIDGLA